MKNRITRREVTKQFIIAIELLLDWIELRVYSREKTTSNNIEEDSLETRLLTAPDVARILNISKGAAYRLIQQKNIRSIHINSCVRVKQEDLEEFIAQNVG